MKTRRYVYDYYKVDVPSDFSEDADERGQTAIMEAEERARIWVRPCRWDVLEDDGRTVVVRRKRLNRKGR